MSFEGCFGGFASSKSAPAAMGGERSFAAADGSDGWAPKAVVPASRLIADGRLVHAIAYPGQSFRTAKL